MNTTMCSTSRIVPVLLLAGIARARRIESGIIASAAAAPADDALVLRKRRRSKEDMGNPLVRDRLNVGTCKGCETARRSWRIGRIRCVMNDGLDLHIGVVRGLGGKHREVRM